MAAVSGRDALKAREMVGLDGMVYVGNHGLERWQDGGILIHEEARQYVPVVREVVEALGRGLDAPGLIVEDKGVTASVHYRLSPTPAQRGPPFLPSWTAPPRPGACSSPRASWWWRYGLRLPSIRARPWSGW